MTVGFECGELRSVLDGGNQDLGPFCCWYQPGAGGAAGAGRYLVWPSSVEQLDGWVVGWMDGWMDGWVVGWVDEWVVEWMDGWFGGWVDGWMDALSVGRSGEY